MSVEGLGVGREVVGGCESVGEVMGWKRLVEWEVKEWW